jgi:von Willebrand factor type A domain
MLIAAAVAYLLYGKSFREKENRNLNIFLASLRFVAFFMLAFLLLEPLIRTTETRVEKPIVVVLADNSLSVVSIKDSVDVKKNFPGKLNSLTGSLEEKFETASFNFGDKVDEGIDSMRFDKKLTDISNAIDEVYTRFYNRNLGAVVLLSDGIYNKGINPLTTIKKFKNVSFYTVGLGDTVVTKDLILADILYNKTAFLGNDYPIEVLVQAKKMQGSRAQLILKENGVEINRREIFVQTNNQTIRTSFLVAAKKEGPRKITAEIIPIADEFSVKNNALSVYVNVVKNKQKVLILAPSPHPDIAAIKYALESSQNYTVTSDLYQAGANYSFNTYNLIILHSLPTGPGDEELVTKIRKAGVPILFVVGNQTGLVSFSKQVGMLSIPGLSKNPSNAQAMVNQNFTSFTLSDRTRQTITKFPPVAAPFGEYKMSPGANVLFYQRIGSISTNNPLIVFNKDNTTNKTGVICGEGIWMWKMHDFELNQNNEAFNEIIQKCVQYLSVAENKTNFRVNHKNEFTENEPVVFDCELFNENYEPINDPDVEMQIINSDKKVTKSTFSPIGNTYRLNAGMLPPGEYMYNASTTYGKKNYAKSGRFIVTAVNSELLRTEADHRLLYQMATTSGGKFYTLKNMEKLFSDLEKNENVTARMHEETTLDDLINKKWLIIIPILLLAIEWFLRKRAGGY